MTGRQGSTCPSIVDATNFVTLHRPMTLQYALGAFKTPCRFLPSGNSPASTGAVTLPLSDAPIGVDRLVWVSSNRSRRERWGKRTVAVVTYTYDVRDNSLECDACMYDWFLGLRF